MTTIVGPVPVRPDTIKHYAMPSHPLSYLYDGHQIRSGQAEAARLLSIAAPAKLAYGRFLGGDQLEAQRLALMGLSVRKTYEHIYPAGGLAASREAYDVSRRVMQLLTHYPQNEALSDFIITNDPHFTITDMKRGWTFNVLENEQENMTLEYHAKIIEAKRAALADYIFGLMLEEAGDKSRDFRPGPKETITAPAVEIYARLAPYLDRLSILNEYASPLIYTMIDSLMINPKTVLPFNVSLPR